MLKKYTNGSATCHVAVILEIVEHEKFGHSARISDDTFVCIESLSPRFEPKVGDYYVIQDADSYSYFCPKDVFEAKYRASGELNFGDALYLLKQGYKVSRSGWNGKGIHIQLQVPDENSKMTSPYIYIDTTGLQTDNHSAPKSLVPWLASQTDMLAEDWCILD